MARIDTPVASDDEFDIVYDAESSSDVEDDPYDHEQQVSASSTTQYANPERLSGPHEVPVLPQSFHQRQDVAEITRQMSGHNLDDEETVSTASPALQRGSSSVSKGKGNLMNDGLQYTKSVYNKWLSKDALIAVMG